MSAAISLLSFFVFPLAFLILFILAVVFSFERKWKVVVRLGIALGIILIFELWQFNCFPGSSSYHFAEDCESITGYSFAPEEIFSCDPDREILGDGYSIWVYQLDDAATKHFSSLKDDDEFFQKFPEKDDYGRKNWNVQHWIRTPISGDDTTVLNFAIDSYFPSDAAYDKTGKLRDYVNLGKSIAHESGNFVAFLHKFDKKNPYDADFYILSPKRKLFFIVNCNF